MFNIFTPDSFYNMGSHFLFLWLITAHICLFADLSPFQAKSMCSLNYLMASLLAAACPAMLTSVVNFPTPYWELSFGVGLALILSIVLSFSIQRIMDINVEF